MDADEVSVAIGGRPHPGEVQKAARIVAIKSLKFGTVRPSKTSGTPSFLGLGRRPPSGIAPSRAERFSDFRNEFACHHWLFQEDHIVPSDGGA
jgi:hypothetical protein